jgi:hypothetical protein
MMEETDDGDKFYLFRAGSAPFRGNVFQTRDERLSRLKVQSLTQEPSKEYMAEYMQFKGREVGILVPICGFLGVFIRVVLAQALA